MYMTLLLTALLPLLLLLWVLRPTRTKRLINLLPGPPALPLIGNALMLEPGGRGYLLKANEWTSRYGDPDGLVRIWMGPYPLVLACRAHSVEAVLSSTSDAITQKSVEYDPLRPWLNDALALSHGDKWFRRRRLMTPCFHFRILSDFLTVMYDQAQILCDKVAEQEEKPMNIFPMLGMSALDIISESAMGVSVGAQKNSTSEYLTALKVMGEVVMERVSNPFLRPDWLFNLTSRGKQQVKALEVLHGFTRNVIAQRDAELTRLLADSDWKLTEADLSGDNVFKLCKNKQVAFLDMLLISSKLDGSDLDAAGIQEEVDAFMFGGHDTTASAMTWAVYCIGAHPDVQDKIVAEINDVFDGPMRCPTMEDIGRLRYLDQVIRESQRIFPTVPQVGRKVTKDFKIGSRVIPAGVSIMVWLSGLHHDPKHFPDPLRFDPDRFSPASTAGKHPYCHVPFSGGVRNCIGQKFALNEVKTTLCCLLSRFKLTSLQKIDDVIQSAEIVLRPLGEGILIRAEPRID